MTEDLVGPGSSPAGACFWALGRGCNCSLILLVFQSTLLPELSRPLQDSPAHDELMESGLK